YNLRKKMYEKSILCLHSILKNCEIKDYAVIKTFDDFLFVGNDIDVVMPEAEFSRMRSHCLLSSEEYHVSLKHISKTDSGKMDIQVLEGLNLDIHSYVGWDKIKYLGFDDLKNHVRNDNIHGFACSSLDNHANSCIIALHVYERGFLTLDEFHYVRKNFEIEFLQGSFPDLSLTFGGYFNALDHVLRSKPSKFPHFFPLWSSTVWYLSMVRSGYGSGKVTAVLRNLGLIFFWNVRYRLKGKIPFEIDY
ncbi:MAG: hypothetical protein ACRD5H_10235, partial [Nitrososphaerales archaeon]